MTSLLQSLYSVFRFPQAPIKRRLRDGGHFATEPLERRELLTGEIRPFGDPNTTYDSVIAIGDQLFAANANGINVTDGRADGTRLVRPAVGSGQFARELTNLNGTLIYSAQETFAGGFEIWKSDGTSAGTVKVKDIFPGSAGSRPQELTVVGATLYFVATNGANGMELWKSDGTAVGTVLVKDIRPGSDSGFPRNLTNVGGTLYFRASDGTHGEELWKSDGTAAGTVIVQDVEPGAASSFPRSLVDVNGTLFFTTTASSRNGLWKSDGTAAGTVFLNPAGGRPDELTNVNGTLFFVANGTGNTVDLWKSDGTQAGTQVVRSNIGNRFQPNFQLTSFNDVLVFAPNTIAVGHEVWRSDGTQAGTQLILAVTAGAASSVSDSSNIVISGGKFYYRNDRTGDLVESDGTATGTTQYPMPDQFSAFDRHLTGTADGVVYFNSTRAVAFHGIESPDVTGPATFSADARPLITWSAVTGATSYEVVISDVTQSLDAISRSIVTTNSAMPTVDLGLGRFRVQVRVAESAVGRSGWSDVYTFRNYQRMVIQPMTRLQTTSRPTLTWTAVPGAATYDLWIDNVTTGQSEFLRTDVTTSSFTPSTDLPMGVYRAWVRARTSDGITGFFSQPVEFVVASAPVPAQPLGGVFSRQPQFVWSSVTGAARYELVVKAANSGQIVHRVQNLTTTNWTPPSDLAAGPYRWWVSAVSADGYFSAKPQVNDLFIGGRTTLLTPSGTTSDRTPTFTWNPVAGAAAYRLVVERFSGGRIIDVTSITPATEFTPLSSLATGRYRAWVRAIGAFQEPGEWSLAVEFRLT